MSLRYKGIIDIFTKFGKEEFTIWFSGKKREGEYKIWHENGKIREHSFYNEKGRRNGQLSDFRLYKSGRFEGEYKAWWPNGQMSEHSFVKSGAREGECKTWESSGELYTHSFWENGIKIRDIIK